MSLLMDALRKAEESKKQAEQGDKKPEAARLPESQGESGDTAASDPQASTSPIPDTQLEFEESPATQTDSETVADEELDSVARPAIESVSQDGVSASSQAGKLEDSASASPEELPAEAGVDEVGIAASAKDQQAGAAAGTAKPEETPAKVALSLEPMDESVKTSTRQPLDVSAAPNYSAEPQLKSTDTATARVEKPGESASSETSSKSPAPAKTGNSQEELEAAMLRASNKFAGGRKPRDSAADAQSTVRTAPAERSSVVEHKSAPGEPAVSTPSANQGNNGVKTAATVATAAIKAEATKNLTSERTPAPSRTGQPAAKPEKTGTSQSGIKLQKPGQSISDRSAPDRRAARSVFAAKRKGKRLRIRRSTKIWALQIVAMIALLGVGYVFFYATAPSNDFNVPAEYLTNTGSFSDDFANAEFTDEVVAVDSDAVFSGSEPEPEPGIEQAAAQVAVDLQDQVTIAVIGEPATSAPAEIDELAQTLTNQAAATTSQDEEAASTQQGTAVEEVIGAAQEIAAGIAETAAQVTSANPGTANTGPASVAETETAPLAPTPPGISFVRRETVSTVDPSLRQAYAAYQRGELATAQTLYQQVLQESPQQRDAMLGLAAIASANQDVVAAMQLYSGLLARDPSDSVARAGLLALRPAGSIADQEREFRRLLAQQGDVAAVVYAVGNFYATQGRWNEAQRQYFNALQQAKADELNGVPVNPDYAFNLAVSLERINQAEAAATYYEEAIRFAASHTASFDLSIARSRLASLVEVGS